MIAFCKDKCPDVRSTFNIIETAVGTRTSVFSLATFSGKKQIAGGVNGARSKTYNRDSPVKSLDRERNKPGSSTVYK